MENQQEFQERPVRFERPEHHFVFLVAPDGTMLGLDDGGTPTRTWHRAGFNRSDRKRAAMLMSFQTADVIPNGMTTLAWKTKKTKTW